MLALAATAACGEVSSPKADAGNNTPDSAPAGDFELSLGSASATSPISGEAQVTVNITRGTGFTDAVVLTATGLPTGVTAAFGANSLPDGTTSTDLKLTIDKTADAGMSNITVTGTAGALTHTAMLSLELQTQTVTGKVRAAGAGITVRLVGKDAIQTDAMGNFTFTDVKVPYDIYVQGQGGTDQSPIPAISYYKALTRLDPVLTREFPECTNCLGIVGFGRSCTVTGTRSGAGTNAGPTYVKFTTTEGNEVNTDGAWSFAATWTSFTFNGNTTRTGRLQGLQATRGALNAPTGWLFKESGDQTLTNNCGSLDIPLTLAALDSSQTAALTGTITQPGGFTTPAITLTQQLGGFPFEVWTATTTNAASTIPLLTNQKASFYARSTGSGGVTEGVMPGLAAATNVSMTLAAPAGLTGPVDNATNVSLSTPFAFTTSANQVYEVRMNSSAAIYVIYMASGSLTIPDTPEMPLPSTASFTWKVTGYGPLAGVNDAADMAPLRGLAKFESSGTFHTLTTSPTRDFTTQ